MTPTIRRWYVTTLGNNVFRINAAASPPAVIGSPIPIGAGSVTWGINYDPDNQEMYVTNFGD